MTEDLRYRNGIDYGLGRTNVDWQTGIRFGVISMHAITQAWCDSSEAQYGDPHCPKCGNAAIVIPSHTESSDPPGQWVRVIQDTPEAYEEYDVERGSCGDYACEACRYLFDSDHAFPEEAIGYTYDADGYKAEDCLDSDVMVIRSEYFTYGPYCSPCVPGAVSLPDDPDTAGRYDQTGVKAYCFSHDWFEEGKAPYKVYRVSDGTEVQPEGV